MDFQVVGPENTHHSWCCRQKQTQIGDGQQGKELVRELTEAWIAPDDKGDCAVPTGGAT